MAEQTTYQVLYWREIPAQIRVYANSRPKSYQLPERFQLKIDRIAMEEEKIRLMLPHVFGPAERPEPETESESVPMDVSDQ